MLALDPPLGAGDAATIGGIVATADSGPLRHRYGGVRDLVVGITVVLSDGTVAKSGGKVIKNVAGYDLAKLFAGSFGTLGLIASVAVRLHPLPDARPPPRRAPADDPDRARRGRGRARPRCRWRPTASTSRWARRPGRRARPLRRRRRRAPGARRRRPAGRRRLDDADVVEDDDELWAGASARASARADGAVLKVAGPPDRPPDGRRAPPRPAAPPSVSRAALGLSWLALARRGPAERVAAVRDALAPRACTVLDGADARAAIRGRTPEPGALAVMERIKARFDPARIFRPGAFVGGL